MTRCIHYGLPGLTLMMGYAPIYLGGNPLLPWWRWSDSGWNQRIYSVGSLKFSHPTNERDHPWIGLATT